MVNHHAKPPLGEYVDFFQPHETNLSLGKYPCCCKNTFMKSIMKCSMNPGSISIYIYTLEVQRPLKEWVFTKDHYFSSDLQSTIPRDYYFNGL